VRVVERACEHYEVLEVPYGKVYSWHPESILFECDCGEMLTWTSPVTTCRCGARYTGVDLGEEERSDETARHPWADEYEEWRSVKLANDIKREYYDFVEVKSGD